MRYFVGIDWASEHDDVCILGKDVKIIEEFRLDVAARGFDYLLER